MTKGPYCPTDPPAEIDNIDENEVRKPDFMSSGLFSECAASITSGGPCQRLSDAYFRIQPTIKPTKKGMKKTKKTNSGVLVKIS